MSSFLFNSIFKISCEPQIIVLFITDSTGPETLIINMPNMWPGQENGSKGGENLDWAGGSIQEKKGINCEMAGKQGKKQRF